MEYLMHHGIKGQKWGVRRYQNPDGTLKNAGKSREKALKKKSRKEEIFKSIGIGQNVALLHQHLLMDQLHQQAINMSNQQMEMHNQAAFQAHNQAINMSNQQQLAMHNQFMQQHLQNTGMMNMQVHQINMMHHM